MAEGDATVPLIFFGDEAVDLCKDAASAVSDHYAPGGSAFTGTIKWVQLDIGDDRDDDLITSEDRLRAAITRQ